MIGSLLTLFFVFIDIFQINFNFLRLHKKYPQVTEQRFGSQNIILSAAGSKAQTRFLYPAMYLSGEKDLFLAYCSSFLHEFHRITIFLFTSHFKTVLNGNYVKNSRTLSIQALHR